MSRLKSRSRSDRRQPEIRKSQLKPLLPLLLLLLMVSRKKRRNQPLPQRMVQQLKVKSMLKASKSVRSKGPSLVD